MKKEIKMIKLQARDALSDLSPYVPGEFADDAIKLSSNENPYGCSPNVRAVIKEMADSVHLYPDGGANALRKALAQKYELDADLIAVGAASDEIIRTLFHAYLSSDNNVVYPEYGFLMYPLSTLANGAETNPVKEINYHADVDGLLKAIDDKTKIGRAHV